MELVFFYNGILSSIIKNEAILSIKQLLRVLWASQRTHVVKNYGNKLLTNTLSRGPGHPIENKLVLH